MSIPNHGEIGHGEIGHGEIGGPVRKASQVIAADIRRRIVRGEIAPGQPLPSEAELAASFRVSRETLRESLGVLESETLITIRRGRGGGAVARQPDIDVAARYVSLVLQAGDATVGDVLEARHLMLHPAAMVLSEFPEPDAVEHLAARCRSLAAAVEDPFTFATEVCRFEQKVVRLSGSKTLTTLISVLQDVYGSVLYLALEQAGPQVARRIVEHHRALVSALEAEDQARFGEAWAGYEACVLDAADRTLTRSAPIDVVPMWMHPMRAGPRRRSSRVVLAIRAAVARGDLRPGDRIASVPELEREFDVSRPTLREALRILEAERLIALRAGSRSGPTILEPRVDTAARLAGIVLESEQATLADAWQARILFEPAAMALSAQRISAGELDELHRREADWSWMSTDTPAWIVEVMEIRFSALQGCHNPALLAIFEIIRWVAGGSTKAVTSTTDYSAWQLRRNRDSARTYRALIGAFSDRAGDRAAEIWDRYLRENVPFYHAQIGGHLIVDLVD